MNADGSGVRRLTTNNNVRHFYPSLAADGGSVLYSSFREQNVYEIDRLDLNDGKVNRLTDRLVHIGINEQSVRSRAPCLDKSI